MIAFSKPITGQAMEEFAQTMVKANQANKVLRVTNEFIGAFQVISPDFFVLPGGEANFRTLSYSPKAELSQQRVIIAKAVEHIANGLFGFF